MSERVRTSDGRRGMLSLLRDVTGTPQAGDTLVWDDVDKHWEPAAPGAASVPDASTTVKGKVELATDGENAAGVVVQGNDARLSDARTPLTHSHDFEEAGAVAAHEGASDPHAGYQKESEKGAANGYASLGADGLVPSAQLPAAGGGSDQWTRVVLAADHTTSATANGAVAGLAFTPAAGKRYLVEVHLLLRTATATVGPRPGFSWPTVADGGAWLQAPNSATAYAMRSWGPRTTQNALSTGVPDTTSSHMAIGGALIDAGPTPSGSFGVTLASETAGTVVTMRAGSVLMYREI